MTEDVSCFICSDSDKNLRFFNVPSDSKRLEEWSQWLNGFEIKKSSIVCEKHFLKEHFTKNSKFNCRRLNKKAIPKLHLTGAHFQDYRFFNKDVSDITYTAKEDKILKGNLKSTATQTDLKAESTSDLANCLWCDYIFTIKDIYAFVRHIGNQHRNKIESFFEHTDYEIPCNDIEEVLIEQEERVEIEILQEDCEAEPIIDTNGTNASCSTNSEKGGSDEIDAGHESEEGYLTNESGSKGKGNIAVKPDINKAQLGEKSKHKKNQKCEATTKQLNIETSDASLVFGLIDLLQTYPQLWFINIFKSKEYEAALKKFCKEFSKNHALSMSQMELHEHLIEIRDWYQNIYKNKTFNKLPYPQTEYYFRLTDFLPDNSNGKTCEFCELLFHDHVQYFAHKQLEHANALPEINEKSNITSLEFLKNHVSDYFRARYPLFQGGFSYQCQICPWKTEKNKDNFFEHIKKHLDIREHVCDICGKSFIKKTRFEIHRKRHFGLYKFKCLICGRDNFTNCSLLTSHRQRFHRPIEGTIEEIEQAVLQRERKRANFDFCVPYTEGMQTLYACACCERKYKFKTNAYMHFKKAHKDQIPKKPFTGAGGKFACPYCERNYKLRTGLYAHIRRAHKDRVAEKLWKREITDKSTDENSMDFDFDVVN